MQKCTQNQRICTVRICIFIHSINRENNKKGSTVLMNICIYKIKMNNSMHITHLIITHMLLYKKIYLYVMKMKIKVIHNLHHHLFHNFSFHVI